MWPALPVLFLVAITVEGGHDTAPERVIAGCRAALGPEGCSNAPPAQAPARDETERASAQGEEAAAPVQGEQAGREPLMSTVHFEEQAVTVAVEAADGRRALRRLEFLPEDSPEQRAIAAGLLVAALAADLERTAAARAPVAEPVRPPPTELPTPLPPAAADEPKRTVQWTLDVGALLSVPLADQAAHLGGDVQLGYFVSPGWGLFASARADTSLPGGLDASRSSLGLGLGVELFGAPHHLSWLVALGGRLEELRLGGGLSDPERGSVLRGGGALSTRVGFLAGAVGLFGGLELAVLAPPVAVYLGGEPLGEVPMFAFALMFGARLAAYRP